MSTQTRKSFLDKLHDAGVPHVWRRQDFPRIRREWAGRRVAVWWITERGNARRATRRAWAFGTLTDRSTGDKGQGVIEIITKEGPKVIHYRRVDGIYDLTNYRGDAR